MIKKESATESRVLEKCSRKCCLQGVLLLPASTFMLAPELTALDL